MKKIILVFLLLAINVSALDFDTSKENYKTSLVSNDEEIRLSDGVFERKLSFLRLTDDNILLKNDNGDVLLIGLGNKKQVDLDSDRLSDVEITYNSFSNGMAEIGLRKVEANVIIEEDKDEVDIKKITLWIGGFVLILIIFSLIKKIKSRKYY